MCIKPDCTGRWGQWETAGTQLDLNIGHLSEPPWRLQALAHMITYSVPESKSHGKARPET